MKLVRLTVSCIAFCASGITLIFELLYAFGPGASETVAHSKELAQTFKAVAAYVTSYQQQHGRLPSKQEFDVWASIFPSQPFSSPNGMWLEVAPFADDVIKQFGAPAKDGFLLGYWRGEWNEYYASWADQTSMRFDESQYYAFGNKFADGAVLVGFAILALLGGRRLWPNRLLQGTAFGGR